VIKRTHDEDEEREAIFFVSIRQVIEDRDIEQSAVDDMFAASEDNFCRSCVLFAHRSETTSEGRSPSLADILKLPCVDLLKVSHFRKNFIYIARMNLWRANIFWSRAIFAAATHALEHDD